MIFYATSNRRHLLPRDMMENERSTAINPGEAVEEKVSLSDRFGLWLGFHKCSQDEYLDMVFGYVDHLGLEADRDAIRAEALEWATTRGARSGRTAWQFIQDLAGRLGQGDLNRKRPWRTTSLGTVNEPGGRFAHGFFRRTGGAGSVTARGGDRKVSGGLDPIPSQRHTAWASRHTHLRTAHVTGPCLLPHCDASRARPSSGADLAQRYSRGWDCCQEQSENITLPVAASSPVPSHVMAGLVPAIPMRSSAAPQPIGITGTGPRIESGEVMT